MTSLNHYDNLSFVTLYYPPSTPPPSSAASPSSPSSNGWTKKITKKIEELKSKLESLRNRKEAKNGYLPEQDSKSLDSIPTQVASLETVKKLAEFADTVDTTKNDNNNILNNLCTGLETFLGFNSASKGYDGTGIVYSDLDRLCDAVMGFLYHLLKDVSEKQPYKAGKKFIDTLINDYLEPNLNLGHDGFKSVITDVVKAVSRYNASLQSSNHKIKSPIDELLNDVKEESKWRNDVNKINVENADVTAVKKAEVAVRNSLDECKRFAGKFNAKFNFSANKNNIKEAIENLNCDLSTKTKNCLCIVKHESERLEKLAEKEEEDYDSMKEKIERTLEGLKNNVNSQITSQVGDLVKQLQKLVKKIETKLEDISTLLNEYIGALQKWIDSADKDIKSVQETVDALVKNNVGDDRKKAIERTTREIKSYENVLENYITQFTSLSKEVNEKITELAGAFKDISGGKALTDINGILEQIGEKVNEIKEQVGENSNGQTYSIAVSWKNLKTYITDLADKVKKGDKKNSKYPVYGGLEGIKKRVEEWALRFSEPGNQRDNFGKIIEDWITNILNDNEVVNHAIGEYFKDNNDSTSRKDNFRSTANIENASSLHTYIIKAIKTNISAAISAGGGVAVSKPNATIEEKIESVTCGMREFAKKLAADLEKGKSSTLVKNIVGAIDGEVKKSESTITYNLTYAMTIALPALLSTAKHLKQELELLFEDTSKEYSLGKNVAEAIKKVTEIEQEFGDDMLTGNFGKKINAALQAVQAPITTLHSNLNTATGTGGSSTNFAKSLDESIEKITDASRLHNVTSTKNALDRWHKDIDKHLTNLMEDIATHGKYINALLEKVRNNKIGKTEKGQAAEENTLQRLHNDLEKFRSVDLVKAIDMAKKFATEATQAGGKTIQELTTHVNRKAEESKNAFTTHAQKHYVSSIKLLLQEFGNKACRELAELPKEIDDDLQKGFKRFVNVFQKKFVLTVKDIETISPTESNQPSPLSRVAAMLKQAFQGFVDEITLQEEIAVVETDISKVTVHLHELLCQLKESQHFDHISISKLTELENALDVFHPELSRDITKDLVVPLKSGFDGLLGELRKAYTNAYAGQTIKWNVRHNPETTYCAKAFLSALEFLNEDLSYLRMQCTEKWSSKQIYASSSLGTFLHKCGYGVATLESKQDGELQNKRSFTGSSIREKLVGSDYGYVYHKNTDTKFQLENLYSYLTLYYDVCHLPTPSSRRPCSVYEMLCWLTGLPHNPVHSELMLHGLSDPFVDPKKQTKVAGDDFEFTVDQTEHVHIDAYPNRLTYENTCNVVDHICAKSHDVLCRILGTGDENTVYAVDYSTNLLKLYYPSSGEECLDMFLDILRRLFPPLKYLQTQCGIAANEFGWAGCRYGKDVHTTKWPCSGHSSTKATCHPSCQANCEPNCQPKSPLMSYLNDCLPGHLPHVLTEIGCKAKCSTCSKSTPGMPCLTPLGFRGFSGTTREGRDICNVLTKFFGNGDLSTLFSLQPKTPSTLPEHFGFTLSLVAGWVGSYGGKTKTGIEEPFEKAIHSVSIELYNKHTVFTDTLRNAYGNSQKNHEAKKHLPSHDDLSSLAMTTKCVDPTSKPYCAPYMSSLYEDVYWCLPYENAKTYLSWAIYLPWTFWDLLNNLYNAFCSINCQDWGCRGCLRGDKCKKGSHGVVDKEKPNNKCQCSSIVDCKGVAPTLYQYGFAFGEASTLNDSQSPKKCSDFCSQLKNVLNWKYFEKLFEECDNFLWIIRQPFSYLVLALWLLSFLYLTHIMVIRLDLLHIKSHLHSPSSHRIAAQSLLAAARVNNLNRVFYLQP